MIIDDTPRCPRCGANPAVHHKMLGILPCESCTKSDRETTLAQPSEFATQTQLDRVKHERDVHAKDIIQPFTTGSKPNEAFVRAYGDKAKDYFTVEQLKKL